MNFYEFLKVKGVTVKKDKGEHIFMQGNSDQSLYFIQSGLLKAYYTSKDGKESVKSFILPKDLIGSLTSSYSDGVCSFSLLCLEPTVSIKIPFKKIQEHSKKDREIANEMIELLLHFAMKKEKREYEFLCLSAEERFCILERDFSNLLEKVTQNDLARYLGVTPVGLSRIKKRAHNRRN